MLIGAISQGLNWDGARPANISGDKNGLEIYSLLIEIVCSAI